MLLIAFVSLTDWLNCSGFMWHLRIFCLSARILLAPLQRCLSLVTLGPVNRESQNQNFNECGISKPSLKSTHVIDLNLWHWVTDWFIAWEIKSRNGLSFHVANRQFSCHALFVMTCLVLHAKRPSQSAASEAGGCADFEAFLFICHVCIPFSSSTVLSSVLKTACRIANSRLSGFQFPS